MKAHIWESGHTVLSLSVTNPGRSTALCAWERNRNSADTSAFRTVISCLSRNVPYYHISQKKEKKITNHCYTKIGNRSRQWGKAKQLLHSPTLSVPVPSLHLSLCSSLMLKDSICFSSTPDHAHCTGTQGRYVMTSTYFSSQSIKLRATQTSLECTTFCRAFPSSFHCYCRRKQHCQFSHQIPFILATAFRISLDFGSMGFWDWFPQC